MSNTSNSEITIPKASWDNIYDKATVQKNIPSNIYSLVNSKKLDADKISFLLKYSSKNTDHLNYFVRTISVATMEGAQFSFFSTEDSKKDAIYANNEVAFYYTNENPDIAILISDEKLCRFLMNGPSLTVSKEGILIFNTKTEFLFTIDCSSSIIVKISDLEKELQVDNLGQIAFIYTVSIYSNIIQFSNGAEYEIVFENINFFSGIPEYKLLRK